MKFAAVETLRDGRLSALPPLDQTRLSRREFEEVYGGNYAFGVEVLNVPFGYRVWRTRAGSLFIVEGS